jgi:hypothetical protein
MKKQEFIGKLENVGLTQKTFAEATGMSYKTVNNWNDDSRPVPLWVASWIENYRKAQHMDVIADVVHPYVKKSEE